MTMPMFVFDRGRGFYFVDRDEAEAHVLIHYRVGGEVKGRRRWQNTDGSLTSEGYQHYKEMYGWGERRKTRAFTDAETAVRSNATNKYRPIKANPIDHESVKQRSGLSDSDARKCEEIAAGIYKKSALLEPKITSDIVSVVKKAGAKMYGLDNRIKQPTSIAGKIGSESVKEGISFEEAASNLKDLIRYTAVSENDRFVNNYQQIKGELEKNGYTEIRCRNYFEQYQQGKVQHKSVQSVFQDKDGNTFELQFQTVASQAAKDLKTPLYERRRSEGLSDDEKSQLEQKMRDLAEQVRDPKNVSSILEHDGKASNSTSDDSKRRMQVRNDNDGEGDPEYTKAVLEKVKIPIEQLSDISKLSKNENVSEARHNINHPDDEAFIIVNTKYDIDSFTPYLADTGRHYNCPNCACAFEMTERGYSVTARRATDGSNVGNIERFFKDGHLENAELTYDVNKLIAPGSEPRRKSDRNNWLKACDDYAEGLLEARKEAVANMNNALSKQGVGARGIVIVGWLMNMDLNDRTTAFHALNYKVEDRGVVFYDSQSRTKYNGFQNNGYFMGCDPRELHFMRTDNLELDPSITETVYSRGKGSK